MHQTFSQQRHGFSLIELMVVLVVTGILAAVAYPAFTSHLQRSRRADATAVLTAVVQAQERYRANRNTFGSTLEAIGVTASGITNHYTVAISGVGEPASLVSGYEVVATASPSSPQAGDLKCATLSIKVEGASVSYLSSSSTGADTHATCWPH